MDFETVGEMLKRAREEKGLSLEEVNYRTKISVRVLATLEQDDLDAFESETYLKGFLKNYAGFLGLDMEKVMRTLDQQRGRVVTGKGTMWDIEEAVQEEKLRPARSLTRLVIAFLLAAVVVLLILLLREHGKVKEVTGQGALAPPHRSSPLLSLRGERRQGWDVQARL